MTTVEDNGVVEMAWDPITGIVGSLGICHEIDFKQKRVIECHSTSSIFRGYSIFMRARTRATRTSSRAGSAASAVTTTRRARSTTRTWLTASARRTSASGSSTSAESAEYMFDHNIFQENLVGVDFCERMVAETNPGVLELASRTGAARRRPRLQDHRRHHALAEPAGRRVLPRGSPGQQVDQGDVLPHGGAPRTPRRSTRAASARRRPCSLFRLPDQADAGTSSS